MNLVPASIFSRAVRSECGAEIRHCENYRRAAKIHVGCHASR